ncbi:valine--tRNA ligase [Luteibaculum oceani]|uniref:Valine--tRNA ligase n=1 Tax=Luteibaculum oceani TaxID=1294296 RepID=A0A5C6VEN1_9FLAO|nr:valine--tRNA ligase [Luteibaculum oceani]TXC81608.1 valine--tRNA ligase [Luteibaculum oceani]
MSIASKYQPTEVENKWYKFWLENKFFASKPDPKKEPFTVVIPPPNVTGVLHMGHMLNNTIQDILVRKARMEGKNACWLPGTDHASIATEAKVVNKLRAEGIKKSDLTRDEFLAHAFEWKDKHGGIILEQLKKLGASCDWDRTSFTMDPGYSESVIDVFIDLYKKGYIYRGTRMVNWDSKALTAVSDEEVIHKEVKGKLYYVRYQVEGTEEYITIATTRPETILADTAVCVHPEDDRFKKFHGKRVIVPLVNRAVPLITDEYVDLEFGTGALKITPAHDVNDYELGEKHGLELINMLNPNGTLNEAATMYVGKDRFAVRKKIPSDLEAAGALVKIEDYDNKVGYSERTDEVIEPRPSLQWFVDMKKLCGPAAKAVETDEVKFHPPKFKNTYRHWMENIKDWCISRQLWWGHQIPAWYYGEGTEHFIVAKTKEEALAELKKKGITVNSEDLRQDEDVLDTWFSSWLWPISTFDSDLIRTGKPNEELAYYYPTNDLVTAPEIMFFWVARMIMAGYEYLGQKPFSNVYYTGIVRDKLGRKMSKSLGNSPDPIKLMEQYGADGVRVGMLYSSPAGNDLLFDESYCEQGRNFCNKIWNALRLTQGWEQSDAAMPELNKFAIDWINNRINEVLVQVNDHFSKYRLSDALMAIYKLVWDDFCSWYLETVKPPYGAPIDKETFKATNQIFEKLLKLLHPFMPFISEEIWHIIKEREVKDALVTAPWPKVDAVDEDLLNQFGLSAALVSNIRNIRNKAGLSPKEQLVLNYKGELTGNPNWDLVKKLAGISEVKQVPEEIANAYSFVSSGASFFIPFSEKIDVEAEKQKIEEELNYTKGFLKSVQKKLANERFVSNAPEQVVAAERKKEQDAISKIEVLESKLGSL